MGGQESSIVTDYTLKVQYASWGSSCKITKTTSVVTKLGSHACCLPIYIYLQILGLEVCADTLVGNEMMRGISGGQRKRVTTGTSNDQNTNP
jgi:hypothetical protein